MNWTALWLIVLIVAIPMIAWDVHKKKPFAGMREQQLGEPAEKWARTAPAEPEVRPNPAGGRDCSYCHTVNAPWKGTCSSCGAPLTTKGRAA